MSQSPFSPAVAGDSQPDTTPAQKNPKNSDDGVLDSIGKAIADPVKTGAEEEELKRDEGGQPIRPER